MAPSGNPPDSSVFLHCKNWLGFLELTAPLEQVSEYTSSLVMVGVGGILNGVHPADVLDVFTCDVYQQGVHPCIAKLIRSGIDLIQE